MLKMAEDGSKKMKRNAAIAQRKGEEKMAIAMA